MPLFSTMAVEIPLRRPKSSASPQYVPLTEGILFVHKEENRKNKDTILPSLLLCMCANCTCTHTESRPQDQAGRGS